MRRLSGAAPCLNTLWGRGELGLLLRAFIPSTMALRVAVSGLGTVGGGVCNILKANAGLIAARCGGRAVELAAVADIVKPEGLDISGAAWYDDAVQMADEADVDVVVETIGGYGIALTCAVHPPGGMPSLLCGSP